MELTRQRNLRELRVIVGVDDAHQIERLETLRVNGQSQVYALDAGAPERSFGIW
jgi:hypothetical protein